MKEIIPAQREKITSITCDCCGHKTEDEFEIQEFLSYSDVGGYGNAIFGDGVAWEIDLCQNCIKILLGRYIRKKEYN